MSYRSRSRSRSPAHRRKRSRSSTRRSSTGLPCPAATAEEKEFVKQLFANVDPNMQQGGGAVDRSEFTSKQVKIAHAAAVMSVLGGTVVSGAAVIFGVKWMLDVGSSEAKETIELAKKMFDGMNEICNDQVKRIGTLAAKEKGVIPLDCHDYDKWVLKQSKTLWDLAYNNLGKVISAPVTAFGVGTAAYNRLVDFYLQTFFTPSCPITKKRRVSLNSSLSASAAGGGRRRTRRSSRKVRRSKRRSRRRRSRRSRSRKTRSSRSRRSRKSKRSSRRSKRRRTRKARSSRKSRSRSRKSRSRSRKSRKTRRRRSKSRRNRRRS